MTDYAEQTYLDGATLHSDCNCCEHAAIEIEKLRKELADLREGRSVILPDTRAHAEAMRIVGEAFLKPAAIC